MWSNPQVYHMLEEQDHSKGNFNAPPVVIRASRLAIYKGTHAYETGVREFERRMFTRPLGCDKTRCSALQAARRDV